MTVSAKSANAPGEPVIFEIRIEPLLDPAFLAASAEHELSPAELKEFEELRVRAKTMSPIADVKVTDAKSEGAVTVSAKSANAPGEPVIFEIRIEHR